MENKTVLILGSSRNDGDTFKLVKKIIALSGYNKIDLNDYNISYYDYEHKNIKDDYIILMKTLIAKYETFIFVTPVYWYAIVNRQQTTTLSPKQLIKKLIKIKQF